MTVTAAVTADQVIVQTNGQITVSSGQTLTITNGTSTDLDVYGTMNVAGTLALSSSAVAQVESGGDASAVFLAGFSRGAIACNYIGLRDDEIASLWRGFICHSHYDGVREWPYAGSDRKAAAERLKHLGNRPQFISNENDVNATKSYLMEVYPAGNFTFLALPFTNHTDTWVLRDIPERKAVRQWFSNVLNTNSPRGTPASEASPRR